AAVIHDAELFTVGPDEGVVTMRTDDDVEVTTTVGDAHTTTSGYYHSARVTGLDPATTYEPSVHGVDATPPLPPTVTTPQCPGGRLLSTVATVNDVHFGETECGKLGTPEELGPIFHAEPGDRPYPLVMNHSAIDEIEALAPDAVVVKGDLTDLGTEPEYEQFVEAYSRLGARMHHVRGNHDAM